MSVARLVRSVVVVVAACAPAALLGCGPSTAEVSGTLTLNGRPPKLQGLQITFIAADGRMASAVVGPDGEYKADAVPVGPVGVAFAYAPIDDIRRREQSGAKRLRPPEPGAAGPPPAEPPAPNPIPEKLRDASTSGLTFPVESGKNNVFNYDIRP